MTEHERAAAVLEGILSENKPEGAVYQRSLDTGYEVLVFPLLMGAGNVCLSKRGNDWSDSVYDYPSIAAAMGAAAEWSGEGDPGGGWVRHWPSGRRRPDGTPASERNDRDQS